MKRILLPFLCLSLAVALLPLTSSDAWAQNKILTLTWQDNSNNEQGFKIERATGGCSNPFTQLTGVAADTASFADTGLPDATTYCYRLRAYSVAAGVDQNSAYSNTAFATTKATLVLTKNGLGTVTSATPGINCGTVCTFDFAGNSTQTLTATATAGNTFVGWSGACTGTGNCTVAMTGFKNVTADFTPNPPPSPPTNLTVQ